VHGYFVSPETLPDEDNTARKTYLNRFLNFFGESALEGLKVGVYQHSVVAREILIEIL
jgi:phosphomannomutase